MPEEFQKQRRAPRIQVYGRVQGQVSARMEAKLVDLFPSSPFLFTLNFLRLTPAP